jgi:periplasmic copper chaperone A
MKRMHKLLIAATVGAALLAVPVATAHISPTQSSAAAGSSAIIGFTVGHGCEGSPTRKVTIQIPAGVTSAKPQPKPGWRITIKRGTLPQPVKDFAGKTVRVGVLSVTWTGGPLPDAYFDSFTLRLGMPPTAGKTLYFKTVQQCVKGVERWIQIPAAGQGEPDSPAPAVKVTKSTGGHD